MRYTPVFLRYNTGRHISDNGQDLAALLEQCWRTGRAGAELAVVAHSMGGLVMRSAVHRPTRQRGIALAPATCGKPGLLGTPHHGARWKAGNWMDTVLGITPFSRPCQIGPGAQRRHYRPAPRLCPGTPIGRAATALPQPRSAPPLPLPAGVACYTVAATTAAQRSALAERLVGDGLVPLPSALGQHPTCATNWPLPRTTRPSCTARGIWRAAQPGRHAEAVGLVDGATWPYTRFAFAKSGPKALSRYALKQTPPRGMAVDFEGRHSPTPARARFSKPLKPDRRP